MELLGPLSKHLSVSHDERDGLRVKSLLRSGRHRLYPLLNLLQSQLKGSQFCFKRRFDFFFDPIGYFLVTQVALHQFD